jgi:hypothetical protein
MLWMLLVLLLALPVLLGTVYPADAPEPAVLVFTRAQ